MSWLLAAVFGLVCSPASAWSVGVVAGAEDGPINNATVQSAVWHALRDERGHDALILAEHLGATHDRMVQERLTSLYAFEVSWRAEALVG